jgi:glutamate/tyrosine decarboxylase-like PLP-dependent enzyme
MYMGVDGYRKTLNALIEQKNFLLHRLEDEKLIKIISNPPTNMCTIQFSRCSEKRLPSELEEKYSIHAFMLRVNGTEQYCYKIYIMPHMEDDIVNEFVEDILRIGEEK